MFTDSRNSTQAKKNLTMNTGPRKEFHSRRGQGNEISLCLRTVLWFYLCLTAVVFNLGYAKTSSINQNDAQELLELWTSSDLRTHEDSSPKWGAEIPETSSIISLTYQNQINNWYNMYSYNLSLLNYLISFINFYIMLLLNTLFWMQFI
jgi:hypothetical protein